MADRALLASRSGSLSPWFEDAVELFGYDVFGEITAEAPEHGQYHLAPAVVDSLQERVRETDADLVAVDDPLHPGQAADLMSALSPAAVRDRRGVVWERLAAGGNKVAEGCSDLWTARLERRQAERAQRSAADADATGVSGSVAELERRCQQMRESLEIARDDQRQRVKRGYEQADTYVAVTGPATTADSGMRAGLSWTPTGEGTPFRPARPVTETISLGPYDTAVTETPGIVESFPEWFAEAVPGTVAAFERAETVVVAGASPERTLELAETIADRFDTDRCLVAVAGDPGHLPSCIEAVVDPESLVHELAARLPTASVELRLPYVDAAHALVSELHGGGAVDSVEYNGLIRVRATVPKGDLEELRRRVEAIETESGVEEASGSGIEAFQRLDGPGEE